MEDRLERLMQILKEENKYIAEVIGHCTVGRLPIRVFLLEQYLEGMKNVKDFHYPMYCLLKEAFAGQILSTECGENEDREEAKRRLEVQAMILSMQRERERSDD